MRRLYTTAVWATLALVAPSVFEASLAGAADTPERTVPQGQDPPGADNGEQQTPRAKHKGVIPPPQTGDEGIYTQAPNPDAGHEEDVIPPPGTPGGEHPNVEPR
jgi:hypothetical protein